MKKRFFSAILTAAVAASAMGMGGCGTKQVETKTKTTAPAAETTAQTTNLETAVKTVSTPIKVRTTYAGTDAPSTKKDGGDISLDNFYGSELSYVTGEALDVKFYVESEGPDAIDLYEDGEKIGELLDDGQGADQAAGDGLYTAEISVEEDTETAAGFYAAYQDAVSDTWQIHFYDENDEINETAIAAADAGVQEAAASYAGDDGYVAAADVADAVDAAADYADTLIESGEAVSYSKTDESLLITFDGGAQLFYQPEQKDVMAADSLSDETQAIAADSHPEETEAMAADSLSDEKEVMVADAQPEETDVISADSQLEETAVIAAGSQPDGTEVMAADSLHEIDEYVPEYYMGQHTPLWSYVPKAHYALTRTAYSLPDYTFSDENVYHDLDVQAESVGTFPSNGILYWNGHGGFNGTTLTSFLSTDPDYVKNHQQEFRRGEIVYNSTASDSTWYCFKPTYVKKHCPEMNGTVIFWISCMSMNNNDLADAFMEKGAGLFLGFKNSVYCTYGRDLVSSMIMTMSKLNTTGDAYCTADEAYAAAVEAYGKNDREKATFSDTKTAAYPIMVTSGENVRLPGAVPATDAKAEGRVISYMTGEPVADVTVSLVHKTEDFAETTTDADGRFSFSGLESGTYYLTATPGGDLLSLATSFTIKSRDLEIPEISLYPQRTLYDVIIVPTWSGTTYCYAYDENGNNAPWPGVEMQDIGSGEYGYVLPDRFKHAKILFTNGTQQVPQHQGDNDGFDWTAGECRQYANMQWIKLGGQTKKAVTPTATPEPTATPTPTATPEPTATPIPTATPEPTATPTPAEQTTDVTYRGNLADGNGPMYCYAYTSYGWINASWPGVQMDVVDAANGIYGYDLPEGFTDAKIIFTNGTQQIPAYSGNNDGFAWTAGSRMAYTEEEGWHTAPAVTPTPSAEPTVTPTEAPTASWDVIAYPQSDFTGDKMYLYAYTSYGRIYGDWPGIEMTNLGNGTYGLDLPDDLREAKILVSDGNGHQFPAHQGVSDGLYYTSGQKWCLSADGTWTAQQ